MLKRNAYCEPARGSILLIAFPEGRVSDHVVLYSNMQQEVTVFIRPYGIWAFFKAFVTIPFQNKDSSAGSIVLEIMRSLLLRREKSMKDKQGNPIVPLPEKTFIMVSVMKLVKTSAKYAVLP